MENELIQLNVQVPRQLVRSVEVLGTVHGWSKRETIIRAIWALVELMERHENTAAKASKSDLADLFLELARLMPAGLIDMEVDEARFSDGRPGLIVNEEWIVARDSNGGLMVTRRDSGQAGRIAHGRIEVLTPRDFDIAESARLR